MEFVQQEITKISSSNATETWAEWSALSTYNVSTADPLPDTAVARKGNYYYRTLTDGNLGNDPELTLGVHWVRWEVSNLHAMVDLQSTTSTRVDGSNLVVTFPTGTDNYINTLVFGNYTAAAIKVEILNGTGIAWDDTITPVLWSWYEVNSVNDFIEDYYDYIYDPYSFNYDRGNMVRLPYLGFNLTIRVTFELDTLVGYSSCGFLVGGEATSMGDTLYGVNFSFNSFSSKTTDTFGIIDITKRGVQELVDFETVIPNDYIFARKRKFKRVYDDIVAFVLDESETTKYDNMITLGVISDVSTVISNPIQTTVSWSIQEVI